MECKQQLVSTVSWLLVLGGVAYLLRQRRSFTKYGRYAPTGNNCYFVSAKLAWFIQEVPALLAPLLLLLLDQNQEVDGLKQEVDGRLVGKALLISTFMLHYFHRSCIFSMLSKGRPVPLRIVVWASGFCGVNGFLQAHQLLHCFTHTHTWMTGTRMATGLIVFFIGMGINIHSDIILRRLRQPGETVYRIPKGGMFELVSGANFLGEIVEWSGFCLSVWSFPSFAFSLFTACSIGPRALQHHRDYQKRFEDYPPHRKALIPFIL